MQLSDSTSHTFHFLRSVLLLRLLLVVVLLPGQVLLVSPELRVLSQFELLSSASFTAVLEARGGGVSIDSFCASIQLQSTKATLTILHLRRSFLAARQLLIMMCCTQLPEGQFAIHRWNVSTGRHTRSPCQHARICSSQHHQSTFAELAREQLLLVSSSSSREVSQDLGNTVNAVISSVQWERDCNVMVPVHRRTCVNVEDWTWVPCHRNGRHDHVGRCSDYWIHAYRSVLCCPVIAYSSTAISEFREIEKSQNSQERRTMYG